MDINDQKFVHLLLANRRMSHEQLAREAHLSRPAVHERVKHLQEKGFCVGIKAGTPQKLEKVVRK
jgi:Lrp/AsnC family leucine-responsive transcriptional regulator